MLCGERRKQKGKLWTGRYYLQITYLTKDLQLEAIKNSYNLNLNIKKALQPRKWTKDINRNFVQMKTQKDILYHEPSRKCKLNP